MKNARGIQVIVIEGAVSVILKSERVRVKNPNRDESGGERRGNSGRARVALASGGACAAAS